MSRLRKRNQERGNDGDAPRALPKARRKRRRKPKAKGRRAELPAGDAGEGVRSAGLPRRLNTPEPFTLPPDVTLETASPAPALLPAANPRPHDIGGDAKSDEFDADAAGSDTSSEPAFALTPESLVQLCQEMTMAGGLLYCVGEGIEWDAQTQGICTYAPEERQALLAFAPAAVPFLGWLQESKWAGLIIFSVTMLRLQTSAFAQLRQLKGTSSSDVEDPKEPGKVHAADVEPAHMQAPQPGSRGDVFADRSTLG